MFQEIVWLFNLLHRIGEILCNHKRSDHLTQFIEIKQYKVNPDFAFHFSNNVNTNTPCGDIVHSIKNVINAFYKIHGNIYNAHIFESEILKLMNNEILGWNHFRQNLTEAEKNIIRSIRLKNLLNPITLLILPWDQLLTN